MVFGHRKMTLPEPDLTYNKYYKKLSMIDTQIKMAEQVNRAKSKLLMGENKKVKHIIVKPNLG